MSSPRFDCRSDTNASCEPRGAPIPTLTHTGEFSIRRAFRWPGHAACCSGGGQYFVPAGKGVCEHHRYPL